MCLFPHSQRRMKRKRSIFPSTQRSFTSVWVLQFLINVMHGFLKTVSLPIENKWPVFCFGSQGQKSEADVGSEDAELAFPLEEVLVFLIWRRTVYLGWWGASREAISHGMYWVVQPSPRYPMKRFVHMKCFEEWQRLWRNGTWKPEK